MIDEFDDPLAPDLGEGAGQSVPSRSLHARLVRSHAIPLGLLVVVVAWSVAAFTLVDRHVSSLQRSQVTLAEAAIDLRAEVAATLQAQGTSIDGGPAARSRFEARLDRLDAAVVRVERLAQQPTDVSLATRIRSSLTAYRSIDGHLWDAVQDGRTSAARNLLAGPATRTTDVLQSDATTILERQRASGRRGVAALDRWTAWSRLALLTLGAAAVAAAVVAVTRTSRRVRQPLAELEAAARQAAAGDLDVAVAPRGDEEIDRLVDAFNDMVGMLRRSVRDSAFDTQLRAALEMVDSEPDVIGVLGEAVNEVVPASPTEFILADPAKNLMEQATVRGPMPSGPQCPVESPFGCAAVRSGQVAVFPSSGELGACPHLRNRPYGMVSAACVPVMFMGRALGVIHTVGPAGQSLPDGDVERLRLLAGQAGSRIGMVRTFDRTQMQATTDALTGLANRRSLEARAADLEAKGKDYAVAIFDLDHFKVLNDTHGHEAGDRALRRFATVLRDSVRPKDLASRFGGEEFVVVLPGGSAGLALAVAERVRSRLAELTAGSDAPVFTVSAGIATSTRQGAFEAVLRAADGALYQAKALGRDRVALADDEDATGADAAWQSAAELEAAEAAEGNPWPMREPDPLFDRM